MLLAGGSARAQPTTEPPNPAAAHLVDGEVLIVAGDEEMLERDGTGFRTRSLLPVAKKVIAALGDHFQTITVWLTFADRGGLSGAYSLSVKNDVRGLGLRLRDDSAKAGSAGVLRTLINMKDLGLRAGDTLEQWTRNRTLSIWGQEYAHRWGMFMLVRDPRTNAPSEMLLGRDCSHYSRYVETQGSVMDGYSWVDNGDGTFTQRERATRFSNLDLYAMGLLEAAEVPRFFIIDGIPGFSHARCGAEYALTPFPAGPVITGTRVDLGMDDLLFANGPRFNKATAPEDSFREAIVILTGIGEPVSSPLARMLAARLNRGREWWDAWLREATRQRLHNCTRISAPCDDPRADVMEVKLDGSAWRIGQGTLPVEVELENRGTADLQGGTLRLAARFGERMAGAKEQQLPALARGAREALTVQLPVTGAACGTELSVTADTQTDLHHSRQQTRALLGMETRAAESFEADSGWLVNPDGDDTTATGTWERGTPAEAELRGRRVQPGAAHAGTGAFVTGLVGSMEPAEDTAYVSRGRTTLQSPSLPLGPSAGATVLRYWVSFAGGKPGVSLARFDPSTLTHLTVLARPLDGAGAPLSDFVVIEKISAQVTGGWTSRLVPLGGKLPGAAASVQLRFVAADEEPAGGAVEAAIDDVELLAPRPECLPVEQQGSDAGCSCTLGDAGSSARPAGPAVLLLVAAALLLRRRQWLPRGRKSQPQPQ